MAELNKYSKTLTQDETQPAAQAMLYGIGLSDDDMKKAQVGVVSMGYDGNTCNMHLNDLAKIVKQGVWDNDLVGLIFNTIGVSDGMSNGTDGMRYSLVSRDIIADSIEAVCGAQYYDGLIALPGCDKNMPGSVIAMGTADHRRFIRQNIAKHIFCKKDIKLFRVNNDLHCSIVNKHIVNGHVFIFAGYFLNHFSPQAR